MQLKDFVGQPCKSKADFEFIPKTKQFLDLIELAENFKKKRIEIIAITPYLLMLKIDSVPVSFFKSGKIIVKTIPDSESARKIAEKLISSLE
jgi:ArsR family metal-binding transcriptional regulator